MPYHRRFVRDDAFADLSECTESYWFGFIYADGCVMQPKRGSLVFSIDLKQEDAYHLVKLAAFLGDDYKPEVIERSSIFRISSNPLCERLMDYGLIFRHKETLQPPPNNVCLPCFMRGFSDGDGSFLLHQSPTSLRLQWVIVCVGVDFYEWAKGVIYTAVGLPPAVAKQLKNNNTRFMTLYRIVCNGVKAFTIRNWLYQHDGPSLDRKKVLAYSAPLPARNQRNNAYYDLTFKYAYA